MTTLHGKRVRLRAPEIADVPRLNAWSNDPDLWANLTGWHFPYSMASTEAWVRSCNPPGASHVVWCIEWDGVLVGTSSLDHLDWRNRRATLGLMIGDPVHRGTGLALDASFTMFRYAFDELGLNRLDGPILATNERSVRLYTGKCGFQLEGVRRQAHFRGGRFVDEVLLGFTASDYAKVRDAYWSALPSGSPPAPPLPAPASAPVARSSPKAAAAPVVPPETAM